MEVMACCAGRTTLLPPALFFFFAFFVSWFAFVRSPSVYVPFRQQPIPLLFNFFLWLWKLAL
jgi:hypothetical protein